MNLPLFPAANAADFEAKPPPLEHHFFLLAYWRQGGWWKAFADTLYALPNSPGLLDQAEHLSKKGWSHIRIIRLPDAEETKP